MTDSLSSKVGEVLGKSTHVLPLAPYSAYLQFHSNSDAVGGAAWDCAWLTDVAVMRNQACISQNCGLPLPAEPDYSVKAMWLTRRVNTGLSPDRNVQVYQLSLTVCSELGSKSFKEKSPVPNHFLWTFYLDATELHWKAFNSALLILGA